MSGLEIWIHFSFCFYVVFFYFIKKKPNKNKTNKNNNCPWRRLVKTICFLKNGKKRLICCLSFITQITLFYFLFVLTLPTFKTNKFQYAFITRSVFKFYENSELQPFFSPVIYMNTSVSIQESYKKSFNIGVFYVFKIVKIVKIVAFIV